MTKTISVSPTFVGLPSHDMAATLGACVAIVGVPYLSPYPGRKDYDSQQAPAAIREASLAYRKIDHYEEQQTYLSPVADAVPRHPGRPQTSEEFFPGWLSNFCAH